MVAMRLALAAFPFGSIGHWCGAGSSEWGRMLELVLAMGAAEAVLAGEINTAIAIAAAGMANNAALSTMEPV